LIQQHSAAVSAGEDSRPISRNGIISVREDSGLLRSHSAEPSSASFLVASDFQALRCCSRLTSSINEKRMSELSPITSASQDLFTQCVEAVAQAGAAVAKQLNLALRTPTVFLDPLPAESFSPRSGDVVMPLPCQPSRCWDGSRLRCSRCTSLQAVPDCFLMNGQIVCYTCDQYGWFFAHDYFND